MRFFSFLPMLLLAFSLAAQNDCHITNLSATLSPPDPNTCQYRVTLQFEHVGTTNQFVVQGNGVVYDILPYSSSPVVLGPFTAGATATTREFVVKDLIFDDCQASIAVAVPACTLPPCNIQQQLVAEAGDCHSDSTYQLFLNFNPAAADSFTVFANGHHFGRYATSQLPLQIPNFPWNGGAFDVVRVCTDANDNNNGCCGELEFHVPTCFPYADCELSQLHIDVGECTSDSTFQVVVDFQVATPAEVDSFELSAGGHFLGHFGINQLPLTIPNFPWNGQIFSTIKVCTGNEAGCCREKQLLAPACLPFGPCEITNIVTLPGACNDVNHTYNLTVNFQGTNPGNGTFTVYAVNQVLGVYPLTALPLNIPNFPASGNTFDLIKICINDVPGTVICCRNKEFQAPGCATNDSCGVHNLVLQTGECTGDSTYQLRVNFVATGATSDYFRVYANGLLQGAYTLSQLPLSIPNFHWNGGNNDVIRICLVDLDGENLCCETREFDVPACLQQSGACEISNLVVTPGDCNPAGGYSVVVNFQVQNPGNASFEAWASNNQYLGIFPLTALPLTIPNFPPSGLAGDYVKVCINDQPNCCRVKEFQAPNCAGNCEIQELTVQTGECHGDSSYQLLVNFQVTGTTATSFQLYANNHLFGTYNLSQLPLTIPNFPWNGGNNDVVKVCMLANAAPAPSTCCKTLEFDVPACLQQSGNCEIQELTVQTGECHGDSSYHLLVNFQVTGTTATSFQLFANGQLFGTYNLSQLPLSIPNFPWNGGNNDVVKVCMPNSAVSACCKTLEFAVPACLQQSGNCEIQNLTVQTGECHGDSSYHLLVNFQVTGTTATSFQLFANGQLFGTYNLSQLPLTIPNFPWNGGNNDVVKVCMANNAPGTACCKTLEFAVPACLQQSGNCEIQELTVQTGECHGDSSYHLLVNFQVTGTTATSFQLFANGQLFGTYNLSQLPLSIPNFPWNGGNNDVVKVCMPNSAVSACCKTLEFAVPDCLQGGACEIFNVVVDPGDCHPNNNTYSLVVNFQVQNPGNASFEVWAGNGQYLGIFPLSGLPLTIPNFPWGGGAEDHLKICINDHPDCCRNIGFTAPTCFGDDCEINNLTVQTGECQGDSTYQLLVNFQVSNPPVNTFSVFANGQLFGSFQLSQLPLSIPHFPWNGGNNDVIKICFGTAGALNCCKTLEFAVPECLTSPCHITDVHALATPCLCGQFFAVVTFDQQGGTPGGFDIVGNGHNYGTFPYNTPQPIILGPLAGDNTTMYEFVVRDHQHPDCQDDTVLGKVECPTLATGTPNLHSTLLLAPNPASDWLNATALLSGGGRMGQSTVQVFQADGRLMLSQSVEDGSSFQLEVSALPAGIYRLAVRSNVGNLEGTFSKL